MERIRICVLFRIRIQNIFFIQTILSLIFGSSIGTILFFFFPSIPATTLPQINCHFFFLPFRPLPQINCHIFFSFYFSNNIAINQLLLFFFLPFQQFHCHKSIATIFFPSNFRPKSSFFFFPSFLTTSLPELILNFSPSFQQLGATILIFFLPFLATWLPQFLFSLPSLPCNFGNLVTTIGFPFEHST